MSNYPKIYVFVNNYVGREPQGVAIAEDGTSLAGHWSSSLGFLRHDMGVTGDWKHDKYKAHYPDGYEIVDLISDDYEAPAKHPGCAAALALAKEKAASSVPNGGSV